MKKYIVSMREVWIQMYSAEAESKEEALDIVAEGGGDLIEGAFEFSHSLGKDTWNVEEDKN